MERYRDGRRQRYSSWSVNAFVVPTEVMSPCHIFTIRYRCRYRIYIVIVHRRFYIVHMGSFEGIVWSFLTAHKQKTIIAYPALSDFQWRQSEFISFLGGRGSERWRTEDTKRRSADGRVCALLRLGVWVYAPGKCLKFYMKICTFWCFLVS